MNSKLSCVLLIVSLCLAGCMYTYSPPPAAPTVTVTHYWQAQHLPVVTQTVSDHPDGYRLTTSYVAAVPRADIHPPIMLGSTGPQLVTEQYLRQQLDEQTAQLWGLVLGEMIMGPVHRYPQRVIVQRSPTWDQDATVNVTFVANDAPGVQRHGSLAISFNGANYQTASGTVTEGQCTTLPGAGVVSTGEYTTVTNKTHNTIEHKISKTVEESSRSSMSLSESLELSNKTTVEAGAKFGVGSGSISDTFSTTFGISKEQTADHSSSAAVTVDDTIEVDAGRTIAIAFTTSYAALDCDVSIHAVGDWSNIRMVINVSGGTLATVYRRDPTTWANLGILLSGDIISGPKQANASFVFTEADDIYRAALGYDIRCPKCQSLLLSSLAHRALGKLAQPETRWLDFDGRRHSVTAKDASYTVIDTTQADPVCVGTIFGTAGNAKSDFESCTPPN